MPSIHACRMRISAAAFKRLSDALPNHKYSAKRKEGFLIDEHTANRISGRYFFTKVNKTKFVNPETLEEEVDESPLMVCCRFAANLTNGVLLVRDRRGDLKVLEDVFNGIDNVRMEIEEFNVDCVEVYRSLVKGAGKVDVRAVRIKDYFGKEGVVGTANFKLTQPENEDKLYDHYGDEIQGVTMNVIVEGKRLQLAVTRKGSIRHADEMPLDIVEMSLNFLPQFHMDSVELEEVEV